MKHRGRTLSLTGGYMGEVYKPKDVLKNAKTFLTEGEDQTIVNPYTGEVRKYRVGPLVFDTLVGTGLSGTLLLERLATHLKCNWLAIRKKNDNSHSSCIAEGHLGERWIFFDDFIGSGTTLKYVHKTVDSLCALHDFHSEFVGAYLYNDSHAVLTPEIIKTVKHIRFPNYQLTRELRNVGSQHYASIGVA